jgi:CRISPR system Cascade subunit CasE
MADAATIFLSKLVLNPGNHEVQRGIQNCHAFHQTVMRGFPTTASSAPRQTLNVLYRPELDERGRRLTVLVQSTVKPDWAPLLTGGGTAVLAADAGMPEVKEVDALYHSLPNDARLRFRLRANPTKRLIKKLPDGSDNKGGGQRVQLYDEADQLAWLERKAIAGGFRIESAQVHPDRLGGKQQVGWRGQRERGREIVLDAVVFDGVLTVTDSGLFQETLAAGIGSGKAYGFGLLSVARAS